ncbi:MAG: site-2 protease family protein [Planctomycetaceae bacterium]
MKKWSWNMARIHGIDIRMHWTFLLLLTWVGISHFASGAGMAGALVGVGFILALFACVVLHELGHAAMAARFGIPTQDITLLPIGGVARLERMPREPRQELAVAIAGPVVNVVIAAILFLSLQAIGGLNRVTVEPVIGASLVGFLANLLWVNVALVLFNLLPAFPMDGGRVLRALLATRMNYARATRSAAGVGQMMAIVFGLFGLLYNPFLLFIAIFVYLGAEAEARTVEVTAALDGATVRDAMMTVFRTLRPNDSLNHAADELLAGAQTDFPVVDDERVWGILQRRNLVEGLRAEHIDQTVADVMTPVDRFATEFDSLEDTINLMRDHQQTSLPVLRNGQVVGLLTLENIGELVMMNSVAAPQAIVRPRQAQAAV